MGTEKEDPKAKEKKEPKLQLRDLKPKKDIKGGAHKAGNPDKGPPRRSGEIDFMNWD
jgi:hypothetical protein